MMDWLIIGITSSFVRSLARLLVRRSFDRQTDRPGAIRDEERVSASESRE
jgi:hypothetical protein